MYLKQNKARSHHTSKSLIHFLHTAPVAKYAYDCNTCQTES